MDKSQSGAAATTFNSYASPWRIGATDADKYFPGSIDEARIYNRVLSEDEVRLLYNQKKPVLQFKMDEGVGVTTYDESFNNNDGSLGAGVAGNMPSWTTGKYGNALSFDGADDYVSVSDNDSIDITKELTVEAWIYPDTLPTEDSILSKGSGSSCGNYNLYVYNGTLALLSSGSCNWSYAGANSIVTVGTWQHVAATFDGTNVNYYINGVLKDSKAWGTIGAVNALALTLGKQQASAEGDFDGKMDDIRVYRYNRSASEISVDYNDGQAAHLGKNNQGLDQGLVGYWDMEEGSGQLVKDKSGNGNDGTLGASSSVNASDPDFVTGHDSSGAVGMGLGFDGGSDFVDAGTGTSLGLTHTGTISLWIKPNSLTQDDFAGFVTKRNNSTGGTAANYSYSFHWRRAGAVIRLALSDGSTIIYATAPLFADTNWHHVLGLWDGTNMKIYKDGVLAATPVAQTLDAQTGATFNTVIGGASFSTSATNRGEWNGFLDEVRMYNRVLSEDEIHMLYNQKKPILEMKFDEGSGTVSRDASFNNNDGTLGGDGTGTDLPVWVQGKFGSALSFDGSDDYIDAGSGSGLNFGTGSYSASWWAKYPQTQSNIYASVFSKGFHTAASYANSFSMTHNNSAVNGLRYYEIGDTTGSFATAVTLESNIPDGWHHFGFIRDVDGNKLRLYDNGLLVANVDYTADVNINNAYNLYLMKTHDDIAVGGYLDEFRMYNYARTASEVLTDYNNGLAAHLK